jgi:hypothetical protein
MSNPKYCEPSALAEMQNALIKIYNEREIIYRKFGINLLDTDALSSLTIYQIIKQYDSDYNINFARNGEDAKSNGILIEQKTTQVNGTLTKNGKSRKGYGRDANWAFHVGGDLDHQRYVLVARSKIDLSVLRIYDISNANNRKIILDELNNKAVAWHAKGFRKNDIITISEKIILENCTFNTPIIIDNCKIFKD